MAKKCKYKQGDKFNYWELIQYVKSERKWEAKCICGKIKLVWVDHLVSGKSISCSCIGKSTHKMTGTPTYRSWSSAKGRCTNPTNARYEAYGGRGITMCDRWLTSFENFYEDMGPRPDGLSLDRIECNGNYEPNNCRWATNKEQSNNMLVHSEKGFSITGLSEEANMPSTRLSARLQRGWSVEDALVRGNFKTDTTLPQRNNTSGVRGVSWDSKNNKWKAAFKYLGKQHFIGRFETTKEAGIAIQLARAALI